MRPKNDLLLSSSGNAKLSAFIELDGLFLRIPNWGPNFGVKFWVKFQTFDANLGQSLSLGAPHWIFGGIFPPFRPTYFSGEFSKSANRLSLNFMLTDIAFCFVNSEKQSRHSSTGFGTFATLKWSSPVCNNNDNSNNNNDICIALFTNRPGQERTRAIATYVLCEIVQFWCGTCKD